MKLRCKCMHGVKEVAGEMQRKSSISLEILIFLFRYGHVIVSVFHFLFVCGPELGRDHNDVFCDGLNVRHLWTGRHTYTHTHIVQTNGRIIIYDYSQ